MGSVVRVLVVSLLSVGYAAAGIAGESGSIEIGIRGSAKPSCSLSAPQAITAQNMALLQVADSSSTIKIGQLTDDTSSKVLPASITLKINVMCNDAHAVSVRTLGGALKPLADSPIATGNFAKTVGYLGRVSWAGQTREWSAMGQADVQTAPIAVLHHMQAEMLVEIALRAVNDLPLMAGTYQDRIILTVAAQL